MSAKQAHAAAADLGAEFVRERVARRYNSTTGALLGAWLRLLTAGGTADTRTVLAFGLSADAGIDGAFTFGSHPLVSHRLQGAALRSNT